MHVTTTTTTTTTSVLLLQLFLLLLYHHLKHTFRRMYCRKHNAFYRVYSNLIHLLLLAPYIQLQQANVVINTTHLGLHGLQIECRILVVL